MTLSFPELRSQETTQVEPINIPAAGDFANAARTYLCMVEKLQENHRNNKRQACDVW